MAKSKETKAAEAKPEQLTIQVDKQEFIRTRDALITSWVTLEGALRDATRAYISHSNAVLGGNETLDISKLDLTTFLGAHLPPPPTEVKEDGEEVKIKQKRVRKPKDPNAPKRPLTAYLAWLGDNRQKIHAELGTGQGRGGISSEGTKRWHALPDSTKQEYKDKYEKETEKYKEELAAYKAKIGDALPVEEEEEEEEIPETEEVQPAAASKPEVSSTDSDSDSDSESDSEMPPPPPKEPTPPPAKTPRSAKKASAKKATDVPASSPPLPASSPVKGAGTFTAVNGATNGKRKNAAKAEPAEEPKKKRTRKGAAADEAPASTPAETPVVEAPSTAKREKSSRKKGRKSQGGDA